MKNKELILIKLAERITEVRKEKGLSIHGLANSADIEYSLVQRVEKGKVNLSFCTLVAIARGLNIDFDELTKGLKFPQ